MDNDNLRYHAHEKGDGSWWENDTRGIPLARVCEECRAAKLSTFRPEVLNNPNYEADEPIEPDDWDARPSFASEVLDISENDQDRRFSEYLERRAESYAQDYPEEL